MMLLDAIIPICHYLFIFFRRMLLESLNANKTPTLRSAFSRDSFLSDSNLSYLKCVITPTGLLNVHESNKSFLFKRQISKVHIWKMTHFLLEIA